jgi:hypothetical protein
MKKILIYSLMMVALATIFTSCSKDDNSKVSESTLIGVWINVDGEGSFEFKKDGTVIHDRLYTTHTTLTGTYTVTKIEELDYGTFFTLDTDYNDNYIGLYLSYSKNPERLVIAGIRDDDNYSHLQLGSFIKE